MISMLHIWEGDCQTHIASIAAILGQVFPGLLARSQQAQKGFYGAKLALQMSVEYRKLPLLAPTGCVNTQPSYKVGSPLLPPATHRPVISSLLRPCPAASSSPEVSFSLACQPIQAHACLGHAPPPGQQRSESIHVPWRAYRAILPIMGTSKFRSLS